MLLELSLLNTTATEAKFYKEFHKQRSVFFNDKNQDELLSYKLIDDC